MSPCSLGLQRGIFLNVRMSLLVILPLLAYGLFLVAAVPGANGWRASAIYAATIWGVVALFLTELLSAFRALAVSEIAAGWLLVDLAAAFYVFRVTRPWSFRSILEPFQGALSKLDDLELAFLAGMLMILAAVGMIGVISPPNTTDAMVYHMPRIVHWLENRSVSFYPTNELRQLRMPPWAEYAMLQVHALSAGDRLDNLVQWFSFAGSLPGVSLIAGRLGAGLRGQVLAAVLCATIPSVILEASGAKNDCVVSFWLVAMVFYLLCYLERQTIGNALGFGSALGLALLTKSTAFILAPPLIAFMLVPLPSAPARRGTLWARGLLIAGFLALSLNSLHFFRNYQLFRSPLGPSAEFPPRGFKYTNDQFGLRPAISNILRNLALHSTTPSASVNRGMEAGIRAFLRALGENPDDPATTWDYTEFHIPPLNLHEATAGNSMHAGLIFLVCAILLWRWRTVETRLALLLAGGLVAAFLLFCVVFKWQPWHTRLHMPLFMLWTAVAGMVLPRSLPRGVAAGLGMVLFFQAAPAVFANQLRPLLGTSGWNILTTPRADLIFTDRGDLLTPYRDAVKFLEAQHCGEVAIDVSSEQFEYPLLVLLGDRNGNRPVRHAFVTNPSAIYATGAGARSAPCVLCTACTLRQAARPDLAQLKSAKLGSTMVFYGHRPQLNGCAVEFSGWYGRESDNGLWWRWSSGKSLIRILASRDLDASLEGSLASIQQPNSVEIDINGRDRLILAVAQSPGDLPLRIPVHLQKGLNTIGFVSRNNPVLVPGDPRPLAIAVKNLQLRTILDTGCYLDQ
jgi:Dolichyl-phosphate-mannose-protein mannosyltransferase